MPPQGNPLVLTFGAAFTIWGLAIFANKSGFLRRYDLDRRLVACPQNKSDEEIYSEMLQAKMEQRLVDRQVSMVPTWSEFWENYKFEWVNLLFPRMNEGEVMERSFYKKYHEYRQDHIVDDSATFQLGPVSLGSRIESIKKIDEWEAANNERWQDLKRRQAEESKAREEAKRERIAMIVEKKDQLQQSAMRLVMKAPPPKEVAEKAVEADKREEGHSASQ